MEARERYRIGANSGVVLLAPLNDQTRVSNPSVGVAVGLLLTTQLPGRFLIVIENLSTTVSIFVSEASYVATSGADRGKPIGPGQERAFGFGEDIILFAIADGVGADINVLEAAG